MSQLKYLMLYKERILNGDNFGIESAFDNMNVLSDSAAKKAYSYMDNGINLITFVSPTIEPLNNERVGHFIYTDGTYLWDRILMHWIKNYKAKLPSYFLDVVDNAKVASIDADALLKSTSTAEIKNAERIYFR